MLLHEKKDHVIEDVALKKTFLNSSNFPEHL